MPSALSDPRSSKRAVLKIWLFCAVFLPVTLSLGFWQLDRAEQKRQIMDQASTQAALPEQLFSLPVGSMQLKPVDPFRPYRLRGHFQPFHVLLDNRTRSGKTGYEVLTPFINSDGHLFWVNRGWVQAGRYREHLPTLKIPIVETDISGHFYLSEKQPGVPGVEQFSDAQVVRVQTLDWSALAERVQQEIGRVPALNMEFRLKDDAQPGALKAGWPTVAMTPQKHTGYAVQWFGLAIALLVLSGLATIKLRRAN